MLAPGRLGGSGAYQVNEGDTNYRLEGRRDSPGAVWVGTASRGQHRHGTRELFASTPQLGDSPSCQNKVASNSIRIGVFTGA